MDPPAGLAVHCECLPVVDAEYHAGSDDLPTTAIIDAVAEAAGVDPLDLPPLFDLVDADALDQLFSHPNGTAEAETMLGFTVETWNVFVHAEGHIRVCDTTQRTEPGPIFGPKAR